VQRGEEDEEVEVCADDDYGPQQLFDEDLASYTSVHFSC
jgi:hypothetical protein